MTSPPDRFTAFTDHVAAFAQRDSRVVGLVAMGSTAEHTRADAWSDHDLALVTTPGYQDTFRHDVSWLPAAEAVAMSAVEHHGGVKVVYDDGHVVELGFATPDELATWHGNAARVLVDKGGVAAAVRAMQQRPLPTGPPDDARDVRVFCTLLLVGVGRARRGEILSAGHVVRAEALEILLRLLSRRLPGDPTQLDNLDPRRRFELVHPAIAERVAAALERDVETAARTLLGIAEEHLAAGWVDLPHRGIAAVRRRLGWD